MYLKLGNAWVSRKLSTVVSHIPRGSQVVDIGAGNGMVARQIQARGNEVTPLDVEAHSIFPENPTLVYDGLQMPFEDKWFDVGLLLTVLHHTDDPLPVLKESARVSKRLIIIEDVYSNVVQQYATYIMDTIVNLGHSNMTYQNKSHKEWLETFESLGLKVLSFKKKRVLLFFRQVTYVLES